MNHAIIKDVERAFPMAIVAKLLAILNDAAFGSLENIKIVGLMGMATFTDNMEQVRNEFKSLKNIFDQMQLLPYQKNVDFCEISMGMSGDYLIAAEEGSTLVRVGSAIFGHR